MTGQAKLVVGPAALFQLVDAWARAGLLAGFVWLDAESVGDGLSQEQWQTVQASRLDPGVGGTEQRLMEYLSHLEGTSSVVALWLRSSSPESTTGLASVESFLQRVFPTVASRVRIDLINPDAVGRCDVPDAVQGWEQYMIATQDHPETDQPDSGWTLTRDAVAVHTMAALVGVLGGTTDVDALGAQNRPRFIHVFSRHVSGGHRARLAATRYHDEQLPTFDAADVAPEHFARPLKPHELLDDCVTWLESAHEGALRYAAPEQVAAQSELAAEVEVPLRGWGLALRQLVSRAPIAPLTRKQADLAEQAAWHDRDLELEAAKEGTRPSPDVWRTAFRLVTSIIDGGPPPPEFKRPAWVKRELVLSPSLVDPDPAYQQRHYPEELLEAHPPLQTNPPLPIADSAVAGAVEKLQDGPSPFSTDPVSPITATTVGDVNERDADVRKRQAADLGELWKRSRGDDEQEPASQPERLLDRVFRDVIRDSLLARLDGDRWRELAVSPWTPDLSRARRKAFALVLTGLIVIAVWTGLWPVFRDPVNAVASQVAGSPLPDAVGYALGWIVGVPLALVGVGLLARAIRNELLAAENESRIRRLLADRALTAYAQASRLDHVARIFGLWWAIFHDLHRPSPAEPPGEPAGLPDVPASLQTAEPTVHVNFEPLMLAKAATEPGWRSATITSLTAACLALYTDVPYGDALTELSEDLGLPEGVLHRLARDLVTGAIWAKWREAEITRVAARILDGLVSPATSVNNDGQTVSAFLGEVLRPCSITPGIHQLPGHLLEVPVRTHLFATEAARGAVEGACGTLVRTPVNGAAAVHMAFADVPLSRPPCGNPQTPPAEDSSDDDLL